MINLIRRFKQQFFYHSPETRASEGDCAPVPPEERYELHQTWDSMDSLTPWAEAEIDRLQIRLRLPGKGKA
ncbi:MAG: hypothetical protein ACPH64_01075 [Porticoccaceae bacterium]